MLCIDGVKGLPRVSSGQPEANLLKMPYGYQGSTRGQLKCIGPSNVANATEHYAAAGALVIGGRAHEVCGHIFEATPPWVKGHPGVNLPFKCPMATKFGEKNP